MLDQISDRANILGVGLTAINMKRATAQLVSAVQEGRRGYVCVSGVHGVMEAQRDGEFRRILNGALMNTPDGMPMSWVGWAQGYEQMDRVYGPDLMLEISSRSVSLGLTHFYYGGKEGVANLLAEKMKARFPGLQVVGTYCPPFRLLTEREMSVLRDRITALKPDFFWIGLSTPKQERCAEEFFRVFEEAKLFLGVGAAFDFHSGLIAQAPRWMQHAGLEWLFRLCCEPRRLWKRYLTNIPIFLWQIALQFAGLRRYELDAKNRGK